MEVTYRMSTGDRCRCSLYVSTRQPSMAAMHLTNLILLTGLILLMLSKHSVHPLTVTTAILPILLSIGGYVAYNAGVLFLAHSMRSRNASTQRMSTTSISSEGVHDVTSMTDILLPWSKIKAIRYHNGDLFFWKILGGIVVPRSAFQDAGEAQAFYQTALGFWCDRVARGGSSFILSNGSARKLEAGAVNAARLNPMHAQLEDRLAVGETVLWQGQPERVPYGKRLAKDMIKTQAADPIAGTMVFFTSILVMSYGGPSTATETLWSFMLFSWVVMAGCYYFSASFYENEAQRVAYEITDQRIWKAVSKKMQSSEYSSLALAEIDRVTIRNHAAGVGTVEFGAATDANIAFEDVANAAAIAQVFTNACGQPPDDIDALFASQRRSDPFQSVLRSGENILWQGQPKWGSYVNAHCGLRGGGVTYLLLIGWLVMLAMMDFSNVKPLWQQIAVIIPAILTAGYILIRRTQKRTQSASQSFYAVTNQRLLLVDRSKASVFASVDLARLQTMQFEIFRSGVGIFSFGGKEVSDLSFEYLAEPVKVRQVITEAKQRLSGVGMEWLDAAAVRAAKPKMSLWYRLGIAFIVLVCIPLPVEILHSSYCDIRYYNPGMRHYHRGEYAAAAADLRADANAEPENEQAPYYLGLALLHEGRSAEARQAFQEASKRDLDEDKPNYAMDAKSKAMIAQIDATKAHAAPTKNSH